MEEAELRDFFDTVFGTAAVQYSAHTSVFYTLVHRII